MDFTGVSHARLNTLPEEVWALIERACAKGRSHLSAMSIRKACEDRDMQLWIATDEAGKLLGATVTKIEARPLARVCVSIATAVTGLTRPEMRQCLDTMEEWAKAQGCTVFEGYGRPGWARLLPDYDVVGICLRKKLTSAEV